jgi:hypothetical protein
MDYANIEAVQAYAADIPSTWLRCRELGHNWGPHRASINEDGGFDRTLLCRRCKSKRHQVLDSSGAVLQNAYEYPDGYQMAPGQGRISSDGKGVFRLASIQQTLEAQETRAAVRRGSRSS